MFPRFALALLAGLCLVPSVHAQPPAKVRLDSLGDPLPEGAIARLGTTRLKHHPGGYEPITSAIFTPDGKRIASFAQKSGTFRMWDAGNGKPLRGPWDSADCNVTAFAIAQDSKTIALASNRNGGKQINEITVWDTAAAKRITSFSMTKAEEVDALVFADEGKTLISASAGTIRWWSVASGKQEKSFQPDPKLADPPEATIRCKFAPGGEFLVIQSFWLFERNNRFVTGGHFLVVNVLEPKIAWRLNGRWQFNFLEYVSGEVNFSADGKRLGIGHSLEILETATGNLVPRAPLDAKDRIHLQPSGFAFSPDGKTVACSSDGSAVLLWELQDSTKQRRSAGRAATLFNQRNCLAFSPDGKILLVTAGADLQLYDVSSLKEIFPCDGHRGSVDNVAFDASGSKLLTGGSFWKMQPLEVATWDVKTWKQLQLSTLKPRPQPNIGDWSPEHAVYIAGPKDQFTVHDFATGALLGRLEPPKTELPYARGFFSLDNKFYVMAGVNREFIYAVPSGKFLCHVPGVYLDYVESHRPIAFSADGRYVALCRHDNGQIAVFATANGALVHRFGQEHLPTNNHISANVSFSPEGKHLGEWHAVNETDYGFRLWELATGKVRLTVPALAKSREGVYFAFSADGRMLATTTGNNILLWEMSTRRVRHDFKGHEANVRALAFSPDSRYLASGSADTTVLIWDLGSR